MPVSLKPRRRLLEEGCRFRIGPRVAEVIAVRPEGYVVIWEEWTDPKTGVVNDSARELLNYPRVETENSHGQLVILSRPGMEDADPSSMVQKSLAWRSGNGGITVSRASRKPLVSIAPGCHASFRS